MIRSMEQREQERVLRNWKDERDSAALYEALAKIERNPRLSSVFSKLAASELEHSEYWVGRLRAIGQPVPAFRPSHDSLGNNLRAAILGATDGLASNFCPLMGVAGGGAQTSTLMLTGVAGLVAGACSMALGEWLSVTNAREMAKKPESLLKIRALLKR